MSPGGLVNWRVLALSEVARVNGVIDQFSECGYRARPGLAWGAHALDNFENNVGGGGLHSDDLDPLGWASWADQYPRGFKADGIASANGEARPEYGPAGRGGAGMGRVDR